MAGFSTIHKEILGLRGRRAWIPFHTLLAMERAPDARDGQRLAMFYAQSWALAHFLFAPGVSALCGFPGRLKPGPYNELPSGAVIG